MVEILKESVIRVQSSMNEWMDGLRVCGKQRGRGKGTRGTEQSLGQFLGRWRRLVLWQLPRSQNG